jgi:hypothetical protein
MKIAVDENDPGRVAAALVALLKLVPNLGVKLAAADDGVFRVTVPDTEVDVLVAPDGRAFHPTTGGGEISLVQEPGDELGLAVTPPKRSIVGGPPSPPS